MPVVPDPLSALAHLRADAPGLSYRGSCVVNRTRGPLRGTLMSIADCGILAVVLVFVFSVSLHAASLKPSIPLEAAAARGEEAAALVDDARLKAEVAAAGAARAHVPVPDFRRRFEVVRAAAAPAIDGHLDDPAWADAVVLKDFTVSQWFNDAGLPRPAADKTEAMVLYDAKGIYVAVRAFQDPKTIYTTIKANGWLRPDLDWESGSEEWADTGSDEIEVVIDPEMTLCSHYVFQVNPDGVRQKRFMPPVRTEGGLYKRVDPVLVPDDSWQAAASRDDKGWYAEIFIPFECIGMKPIVDSSGEDVFFDMVQDRTVMGFNVNRISHVRREPSSWSPSKGPMFFRDPEHFGAAYFHAAPASFENAACGDIFRGENSVSFEVRSRSAKREGFTATLTVAGDNHSYRTEKTFSVEAGGKAAATLDFAPAPLGRQTIDLRLIDSGGDLVDRRTFVYDAPATVGVVLPKTVLYEGEADFPVDVTVTCPAGGVDEVRYRVRSRGKIVASFKDTSLPVGDTRRPFELSGLKPGEYEFEAEAFEKGKSLGDARAAFAVIADPFKAKVKGTAGKAVKGASAAPSGFAALGAGDAGRPARTAQVGGMLVFRDEDRKRGYAWYAVTATADFRASAVPRLAETVEPIRAFAAGGEYEAVSFAVFAIEDVKAPRFEFTELRPARGSGKPIPVTVMDLRAERPDTVLVKQEVLGDLAKNTARRYMLTIYVAPGTPAGVYTGTLRFTAGGKSDERPYSLLVLPFQLPASPISNSIYGSFRGGADVDRDRIVAADLLAHGMDHLTCTRIVSGARQVMIHHIIWDLAKPTEENWLGDGRARFDAPLDESVFKFMKSAGLRGPIVVEVNYYLRYLAPTAENAELFEAALGRIEDMRRKYGLPEFVYHVVDEPNNHYTYDDGRYGRRWGIQKVDFFGKVLHKLGLRVYVTMNSAGRGYDFGENVRDQIDIWCSNFISDPHQVDRWTTDGKEVWLYNYAGDGRAKGAMRSTYGLYAARLGARGVTIWNHSNYVSWDRAAKKCLATVAWEAGREGVDDGRYVALLRDEISKAKAKGGSKARLAARAQAALDEIVGAYPVPTWQKVAFEKKHDASE